MSPLLLIEIASVASVIMPALCAYFVHRHLKAHAVSLHDQVSMAIADCEFRVRQAVMTTHQLNQNAHDLSRDHIRDAHDVSRKDNAGEHEATRLQLETVTNILINRAIGQIKGHIASTVGSMHSAEQVKCNYCKLLVARFEQLADNTIRCVNCTRKADINGSSRN